MFDDSLQVFLSGLKELGLLEGEQESNQRLVEQFLCYRQELLDWNTRFNLTAITDPQEVLLKHFLDSLSLLTVYDRPTARLLDIGSGAGFPGIPLKLVRPQWQITLLEATGKKVTFLRHMITTLQLEQIEVVQGRAEELAHRPEYRASFDIVTARAVAALPILLEYCAPYCRVGGAILLPKKGDLADEMAQGQRAATQVGALFQAAIPVALPQLADERRLLVWKQQKLCSAQFPRSGAAMAKRPLG